MRLKEKEKGRLLKNLSETLKVIYNGIFNKKTGIVLFVLFLIIFFVGGFVSGLIISGFFGTLDNPSKRAVILLNIFGIHKEAKDFTNQVGWILDENIRIPFNFISGKFSNPEKIYIDIAFTDYKKLEYKREQALGRGILVSSGDDYVPGKIRYRDKETRVDLRLKGDFLDHLKGDKWSFRIKVKDNDALFGMRVFSIQAPGTRNYLNEWIFQKTLRKAGIMSIRYEFIEVVINGENKGIYAIEENFDKELIENNNRREGVIVRFDDSGMGEEIIDIKSYFDNDMDYVEYLSRRYSEWSYIGSVETFSNQKILMDPVLSEEFKKARGLLDLFRNGKLKTHEVFDVDILAKYYAILAVTGCAHGSQWDNIRFYYNPVTSLLEPIGYDGNCGAQARYVIDSLPECLSKNGCSQDKLGYSDFIFMDDIFFKRYVEELERVSQKDYLDELFLELDDEINKNVNIIHKDYPTYHFSEDVFYVNQNQLKDILNPVESVNAYFKEYLPFEDKIVLYVGNTGALPIEIDSVVYNNSYSLAPTGRIILNKKSISSPVKYEKYEFKVPSYFTWEDSSALDLKINYKILWLDEIHNESVLPWSYVEDDFIENDFIRKDSNINSAELFVVNENSKKISVRKGMWVLNESVMIPSGYSVFVEEGTTIDLVEGALIFSYSNLQFKGSDKNPIKIISSDKTGQGLVVLKADRESKLENVIFEDLVNPHKEGWALTGAVTFYESSVVLDGVVFSGMNAEDSLNIVNSDFEIKNSKFEDCFSDCFDDDFGEGQIENSLFVDCGNDCIDVSGAPVRISNTEIINAGDKGVSSGENAILNIDNLRISSDNKTYIGIAAKDLSEVFVENSQIANTNYALAVYQKKAEFGGALISAENVDISETDNDHIVERGSELYFDDTIVIDKKKNVFKELYGI